MQQSGPGEQPAAAQMSLAARLMNVFLAPGEVFAEIKDRPVVPANWVTPMILAMIAGIIYTMVVFSQPAVIQGMKETQEKALQERVTAGKMTQQQADAAAEMSGKFMTPTVLKLFGIGGSIIVTALWLFFCALIVWLVGRFGMHGGVGYMRAVEIMGLSLMISVLGAIIGMLLAVIYGSPAMTPSAILLVGHLDPHSKVHAYLGSLNVMTLWSLAVVSLGLGQVTGKGFARAAAWLYGIWAVLTVVDVSLLVR